MEPGTAISIASSIGKLFGGFGGDDGGSGEIEYGINHPGVDQSRLASDPFFYQAAVLENEGHRRVFNVGWTNNSPGDKNPQIEATANRLRAEAEAQAKAAAPSPLIGPSVAAIEDKERATADMQRNVAAWESFQRNAAKSRPMGDLLFEYFSSPYALAVIAGALILAALFIRR